MIEPFDLSALMMVPAVVLAAAALVALVWFGVYAVRYLVADEPVAAGGMDAGPGPYDFLLAGLGACTSMTMRLYADRKSLPLDRVTVTLTHC